MRLSNDILNEVINEVWTDEYGYKHVAERIDSIMEEMLNNTADNIINEKALTIMFPWDWPKR